MQQAPQLRSTARYAQLLAGVFFLAAVVTYQPVPAQAMESGTGEGTSAPFGLYLGRGYRVLVADVGEATSSQFAVYLGRGYRVLVADVGEATSSQFAVYLGRGYRVLVADVGEATSSQFAIYLGRGYRVLVAGVGEAISPWFPLDTHLELTGVVRVASSGIPLPGATVELLVGGSVQQGATTDGTGKYVFSLLEGTYDLRAFAINHVRAMINDVLVTSGPNVVDIPLLAFLVSDDTHFPNHYTHWEYDQDTTITWRSESPEVDSVAVQFRVDTGDPWTDIGFAKYPIEYLDWPGESIPDVSTTSAEIRYKAFDSNGEWLGTAVGDPFALYLDTHVLIKPDRHVFTWDPGPPQTKYYKIVISPDPESNCQVPFEFSRQTADRAPYYQLSENFWDLLEPLAGTYSVTAYDNVGADLGTVVSDTAFVICDVKKIGLGGSSATPVVLIHGWTGRADDWNPSPDQQISSILASSNFDAWVFGYPSIGDIRVSAGGLQRSLRHILDSYPDGTLAGIIAHSLGGLVSRAYIQDLATTPDGPPNSLSYNQDVSHLVTLGTPHEGGPLVTASFLASDLEGLAWIFIDPSCYQIRGPAVFQANSEYGPSVFLRELNDLENNQLDPSCLYLFARGDFAWGPRVLLQVLEAEGPSDGIVNVESAWGESIDGLANYNPFKVNYLQHHVRLAKFDFGEPKAADVLNFLLADLAPTGEPLQGRLLRGAVRAGEFIAGGILRLFFSAPIPNQQSSTAPQTSAANQDPFYATTTKADGTFTIPFLPPGSYEFEVSAPGAITQRADVVVDTASSGWNWEFVLESDPGYVGPSNPWVEINGGALVTTDSLVSISVGVDDANDMLVSDRPDFAGASWAAITSAVAWSFQGGTGPRFIYAKFRDALARETDVAYDAIELVGPSVSSLVVDSSPVGASVYINGTQVPGVTPTTLDSLNPGTYWISVGMPGHRPDPSQIEVELLSGQQTQINFALTLRQPPIAFNLLAPADNDYANTQPAFTWEASFDPEANSTVYYNMQASRDTTFQTIDFEVGGLSATQYTPSVGLDDSTKYAWRVRATTVYELTSYSNEPYRWIQIDDTPPAMRVLHPNGLEVWDNGDTVSIEWDAEDYTGLDSTKVALSIDGGFTFDTIAMPNPAESTLIWVVPDTIPTSLGLCFVRVTSWDPASNEGEDTSDDAFSITSTATGINDGSKVPREYTLYQNVPNPFNPTTNIRYDVPVSGSHVTLRIYDVVGALVRTLIDGVQTAGTKQVTWHGDNGVGERVASGVYFYRMTAAGFERTRKMVLLQ